MARRIIALGCLVAGVWLLAGPGWALLAAGVLVEVAWPHGQANGRPVWAGKVAGRAAAVWGRTVAAARAVPQQIAAVFAAAAGVTLVPVGVGLLGGAGAALFTLGVLLLVVGVQLDRAA